MDRAKWLKVHSWVGFKVSILLCFVLITGTLAVLSHEIDWLTNPAMRISPSSVNEIIGKLFTKQRWKGCRIFRFCI